MIIRRLIFLHLIVSICNYGFGQDRNSVDSLKTLLATKNGADRLDLLSGLFDHYKGTEYKVALSYAVEFENLAKKLGDSVKIVEGARKVGYTLMDLGKNVEAIAVLEHALSIAERNKERLPGMKKHIKFILNNAGIAYTSLGNYDRALEYHLKSLLIREGEGDKKSIASALNNLGSIYYDLRDSRHSIEFLQRAVNIKKEISDFDDLDRILINIGICYSQLGEFERGIGYLNEGLNVFGINCSDNIKMEGLLGLGVAYLGENILDKAEDCLTKSLSISKAQNNTLYQVYNLDQLSLVESKKGNMSVAIRLLEEAEVIAKAFSYVRPLIQIYNHFSIYYNQKYDFEKTAFYLAKYRQLQDSIYSIDLIKNISKVETDFTARDNIKALNSKNETLGAKLELIKGQRSQFIFVAAIIDSS